MTGIELLARGRASTRPTPSCCCSRRTPTPTSRSRRSTTSASTTTCSSRGTRPRSGSTRSSTTCSTTGAQDHPERHRRRAGRRPPVVRPQPRASRRSWPATTCPTAGSTSSATTRRAGCSSSPAREPDDLPLVLVPDGEPLRSPDDRSSSPTRSACAPAPSSRSTTCASSAAARPGSPPRCTPRPRGCSTVIVERDAPGGQAGQSAAIENYLGFPKGLSGADLTQRAVAQASRFGAEMVLAREVVGLRGARPGARRAASTAAARSRPRRARRHRRLLPAARGAGARRARPAAASTTAPPPSEAAQCAGDEVYVVGAANSAGQAVLNFARYAKRVVLRRARRARSRPHVGVPRRADPGRRQHRGAAAAPRSSAAHGDGHLERAHPRRPRHRRRARRSPTNWLFVFIGASPRTDWLGDATSSATTKGFVVTGPDLLAARHADRWPLARAAVRAGDERARASSPPATCGSTR